MTRRHYISTTVTVLSGISGVSAFHNESPGPHQAKIQDPMPETTRRSRRFVFHRMLTVERWQRPQLLVPAGKEYPAAQLSTRNDRRHRQLNMTADSQNLLRQNATASHARPDPAVSHLRGELCHGFGRIQMPSVSLNSHRYNRRDGHQRSIDSCVFPVRKAD